VRSVSSVTLHLLRMLEEMLLKGATHNLIVRTRTEVALYVLNHKGAHLRDLETRFHISITVNADANVGAAQPFLIEKGEQMHSAEAAKALLAQTAAPAIVEEAEDEEPVEDVAGEEFEAAAGEGEADVEAAGESAEPREDEGQRRGRRRRRRGRGGREGREGGAQEATPAPVAAHDGDGEGTEEGARAEDQDGQNGQGGDAADGERRRRRRGRRGGRRNRRGREGEAEFRNGDGPNGYAGDDDARGIEPELADAIADLGGPGRTEAPPAPAPHEPQPFEPVARDVAAEPPEAHAGPAEPAAQPEPPAPAEPPKRRSTVREPAPMFSAGAMSDVQPPAPQPPAAPPEPVVAAEPAVEPAPAEAKPRRFGWWSRRG
jgi:ribonuclease E